MSFQFAKPSDFQGGAFFKPGDHMSDLALLFEPKKIDKDVRSSYQGAERIRDEVTADVTVFGTQESIDNQTPTAIMQGVRVTHGMVTGTLERNIGSAMVAVVRRVPTAKGSGFALRDVENPANIEKIGGYYTAREAAIAEAAASAPSFDA